MLFNTILINAVLALTSVTAIPNPDVGDVNLEDRDAEVGGGYDDSLDARSSSCRGSGWYYHGGRCRCRMDNYIYDSDYGCHYDCHDSGSYWSSGSCRCRRSGYYWDDNSHRCRRH
ncbi:hypothetical protein BKA56DRAFT_675651 [Ilyonectria sp. MPI-CAGE-AT-0026]|nr:hypothetical protein BKA56DRAFT_675651 [Ilyonectria sp. MPI-CAGE-AT-0026]